MKRFFTMMAVAIAGYAGAANAALPEVVIGAGTGQPVRTPYCQGFDRTLDADTIYVLTGLYYVEPGVTLTIEPGTIIKGHDATGGTLIITRGGQIFAQGTQQKPIVFTSEYAPGLRASGDWGGIIILGDAPTNKVDPLIEGGLIPGTCSGGGGTYGGADPSDDSGVMSYVRIEFPGFRFATNNEVNGLTMGGVGGQTQIDHIQVSYSDDDSYEWFGGTVDCSYLVAFGGTDDEFDADFGYRGDVQFGFGLRDPDQSDPTGESNGFETDNDGSATSTATPYTKPTFSNITLVGPERTDADVPFPLGETYQYSMLLRRS
ncbi:MAG: T9SS C-terminal target domain-containing protein, partial [Candidatus Latescibacteria bacterium]|nr:T9SS C-terminal target domain-containing protein [Candidatus Latescibacterota bacterium]